MTLTPSRFVGIWLLTKSEPCQMRESPAGARFEPLISTHVLGAIDGLPPSAFATCEISGTDRAVIVNVRDMIWRFPVSQPFMKKMCPVSFVCPAGLRATSRRDTSRQIPGRDLGAARRRHGELRVLDDLRRCPVLKVEACRGRVIPGADLVEPVQTNIATYRPRSSLRLISPMSCEPGHPPEGRNGLSVPPMPSSLKDPLFHFRNINGSPPSLARAMRSWLGVSWPCDSHRRHRGSITARAPVDECARDRVAQGPVRRGWLGNRILKHRMACGAAVGPFMGAGHVFRYRMIGRTRLSRNIRRYALPRAMIFGFVNHDEVSGRKCGILHHRSRRRVVAVEFGMVVGSHWSIGSGEASTCRL